VRKVGSAMTGGSERGFVHLRWSEHRDALLPSLIYPTDLHVRAHTQPIDIKILSCVYLPSIPHTSWKVKPKHFDHPLVAGCSIAHTIHYK